MNPPDRALPSQAARNDESSSRILSSTQRWLAAASILGLAVATTLLYRALLSDWFVSALDDPTFSYVLWVPLLSVYVTYLKARQLDRTRTGAYFEPSYSGYTVIAASCVLLLAGELSTLLYIARLSFLVVLAGIALTAIGWKALSYFSFPAGYLLFAVPLPALIYVPLSARLQMLSSALAGASLDLLGVPALREGNIITLPNNQLEVIEACSGIHSLFALLAVATLAGYLLRSGALDRGLIALSAIPLAILLNAVRITTLGVLSYDVGPAAAAGFAHLTTGMVIFMVGCVVILVLCGRQATSALLRPVHRSAAAPSLVQGPKPPLSPWLNVFAIAGLLALSFVIRGNVGFDRPVALHQPLSHFPLELDGWKGREIVIPPQQLSVLRADSVIMREYERASAPDVALYVAYFAVQREGTAMHSPLHCIPGAGWEVARQSVLPISSVALGAIEANKVIFVNGDQRMLVVYWYMEQGRTERGELTGAMATLWHAIFKRRTDGCLIRVSAPIIGSEQATLDEVIKFIERSAPLLITRFLPG